MAKKDTIEQFDELKTKMNELESRLERIETLLATIADSSTKMDSHIHFVEKLYQTIQTPFFNVLNFFNAMTLSGKEKTIL